MVVFVVCQVSESNIRTVFPFELMEETIFGVGDNKVINSILINFFFVGY